MQPLRSLFSITLHALKALGPTSRLQFYKSLAAGMIIVFLEFLTVAAIIPILLSVAKSSAVLPEMMMKLAALSPATIFFSVVFIFLVKTAAIILLTDHQLAVANRFYVDFSRKMYSAYFNQDFLAHAKVSSADAFRKIKNTAYDFSHHVIFNLMIFIGDMMIVAITLTTLSIVDYRVLYGVVSIGIPTAILFYIFKKQWISQIDQSFRELTPRSNVILSQGIDSYVEARIYRMERQLIDRFLQAISTTSDLLGKLKVLSSLPARIMEFIGISCFAAIILFGNRFFQSNEIIILVGLLSLAVYKIMPLVARMMSTVTQIQSYAYSVDEICGLGNETENHTNPKGKKIDLRDRIVLSDIHFRYERTEVDLIAGLSEEIKKGDFVLLSGPSGSGKTTLMNILTGLIVPDRGSIYIDNVRLTEDKIPGWQSLLGFVPQDITIHNDTVLNNITLSATNLNSVSHERLQLAIDSAGLYEFLASFPDGLETMVGEHGLAMSGGQRQRIALARALYRDPEVLLLDEGINQLDDDNKLIILKKLKNLTHLGKTIVLSSHDPVAKNFATRHIVFEKHLANVSTSRLH